MIKSKNDSEILFDDRVDRTPARFFRHRCRKGEHSGPTAGCVLGFTQANLVVLPKEHAFDFLLFCQRNPKPCPLLDVTEIGDPEPRGVAIGADLRTDLPLYRVYRHGKLAEEVPDIKHLWRNDFVGFLIGCSFTFESALLQSGLAVRHLDEKNANGGPKNVPMYRTNRPCRPAGVFHGPLVVSMRPFTPSDAIRAVEITSRFPTVHGSPVHIGDPAQLGIADLEHPDWGDPVSIYPGEVPVFWACGVVPQAATIEAKHEICITHSPGHMFVCDVRDEELASR